MRVTGLNKVFRRLNRKIDRIKGYTEAGLTIAAMVVKSRSMELTPHDTGNLEGSAYTSPVIKAPDGKLYVIIGYTADYALWVHEIKKNYRGGQWKYLVTALKNTKKRVLSILRASAAKGIK